MNIWKRVGFNCGASSQNLARVTLRKKTGFKSYYCFKSLKYLEKKTTNSPK